MTKTPQLEPWHGLPAEIADVIEPELDAVTAEILEVIAREVPEYARPLEGRFGRGLRRGVVEALRQFVDLIRDPGGGRGLGRDVYVELGRGELRQGRTLDSLQAAYRVGARVAWRRLSAACRQGGVGAADLSRLAEAMFAYIDELSADSVEGYAEARSELEGERRRRARELAAMLVRDPQPEQADLLAAAERAGWALPREAAALACAEPDLRAVAGRLPAEAVATTLDGAGCVLLPDPEGPGRDALLRSAAGAAEVLAQGPAGPLADLPESWALARAVLRAAGSAGMPAAGPARAEDRLGQLLLHEGGGLAARIAARRLAPLDDLTEKARERMRETALAYLMHRGNSVEMAEALHLHPQTVRYRSARLRELLGEQLDDPDGRFELEIALRYGLRFFGSVRKTTSQRGEETP